MEKYSISNEHLKISILEKGAELCSIKNLTTGKEHLWQANPEIWNSHAPNLFPIIGILKDGFFLYKGEKYEMPKHGMLRNNKNIRLKEKTNDKLVFELIYSEETLKIYPFKFDFQIIFKLKGKTLEIGHKITNLDNKTMYFSVGGHPAFNAPVNENEEYEDYYLEFDQKMNLETYLLNENGLLSNKTEKVLENSAQIQLHKHLFDRDALIFKNISSKKVSLKSKISGTILSVEYPDFKNLGIWAKPGAPYICIEPWLGIADVEGTDQNLKNKEGILSLGAGKEFEAAYKIIIE
ncbi:aldose 1-epimerase family protein [Autumnicola musiva]|uniref:Aldose 1-epimerase family protein n=1 Tax=Autumnicola musiva TaxID=3075589 RepID=A0ABU3D5C3_9FLAO|nr:aldose 1-epimerase family protein [Zunongwangia sp. F117]MDT0676218.1 aldose 1-epimerase family protein [Zunongwangia sp. F117]